MEKQTTGIEHVSQIRTALQALFISVFILIPSLTIAQSGGGSSGGWSQRAKAREGSRWTLQEWLAQKDRNRLMDQWLMMNSPSPFEFYLLGASNSYKSQKNQDASTNYDAAYSGSFGAYAQAVGLVGEYENNQKEHYSDATGILNIRVLGDSLQTTSITIGAGQRNRHYMEGTEKETVRNLLSQVVLQAYFTKYFGLIGTYRYYHPADHTDLGQVSGALTEGGLFIDFKGFRVFGVWSDDKQVNRADDGTKTEYKRQGIKSGFVIFF